VIRSAGRTGQPDSDVEFGEGASSFDLARIDMDLEELLGRQRRGGVGIGPAP
jgi:hypothetical protein